ncbi:MAG: AAA family ATPase [Oscillospiraceae bacterium]|nr:AAA family ATPase [Oscillospiraceae bacterium]
MQLKDLNKVTIIGEKSQLNNTTLELFKKLNNDEVQRICNIYGKNGTGKTTISKAINNVLDEVAVTFYNFENTELTKEDDDKIYLYDEDFIDKNIKISDNGIKTIVMFGEQKEIDDKITKLTEENKTKIKVEEQMEKELEKYRDVNNVLSPLKYQKQIDDILKNKSGWANRDKDIKGNMRATTLPDNIQIDINNAKEEKIAEEELSKSFIDLLDVFSKVDDKSTKMNNSFEKMNKFKELYENVKGLLEKKIDKAELTERETKILEKIESDGIKFYENVKADFSNNGDSICPYCLQIVKKSYKEEVVKSIDKLLSEEVEIHKKDLEEIKTKFSSIEETSEEPHILDEKQFLELNNKISKINEELNKVTEKIDLKVNNIYNPIIDFESNIITLEGEYNNIIEKLEKKRKEFNKAIDEKNENKLKLENLNLQIAWYEIKEPYNNLSQQLGKQKQLEKDIAKVKQEIENNSFQISTLKSEQKNVKIAIGKMNKYLEYVFLAKDRLKIEYNDKYEVYQIKVNNKDIKPKNLSVGERNVISLCYFFITILENTNEDEEFKSPCLIILDDPISSLDSENKIGIYSFLRMVFEKILKNNNESKIINLTHSLEVMFNLEKISSDINSKYALYELYNNIFKDFGFKKRNEYKKMLEDIYIYANEDEETDYLDNTIGNTMRKTLEAYATFNYNKSIEELTNCDDILAKIEGKNQKEYFSNFMYRLVLHGESHSYDSTRNLDFYDFISKDEKVKTAKSILILLYLLDSTHLNTYFNNNDKVKNIINWQTGLMSKNKD